MIRTLLLVSLASCAVAKADPKPPGGKPADGPSACKATGSPLFQIDQLDTTRVTASTKIYDSGAWTTDGASGCTDEATIASVRALLAAPWTISHPIHCDLATSKSTSYYSNGKLLFNERVCNADALDDKSAKNLAELVKLAGATTAPVGNPSCKASGDVLFQIDRTAIPGAKLPTSVTKIYDNGAWTIAETNPDGSAGGTKAGCFDAATKARVTDDLKAPWTVIVPRIRCRAMAQTFVNYSLRGKGVFVREVCGNSLDDVSAKKLDDIEAIVAKLAP
jgi:hypothetical protein